jgi:uncharacterized membrane protein
MSAPSYTLTDLDPFDAVGGAGSENGDKNAPDINASGVIVAPGLQPDGLRPHATARFVKNGHVTLVDVGNIDLHLTSDARGVNDANQIVGAYTDNTGTDHAFLAQFGKKGRVVLTPLGDVAGLPGSIAYAINNLGQMVGSAGQLTGAEQAVLWQLGKKGRVVQTPLPRLGSGNIVPGIEFPTIANDVNDSGVIAGMATDSNLQQRATLWFAGKKGRYSPVALDGLGGTGLGALNGSYAHAMNNANVVVGNALASDLKFHPTAWIPGKKGRFSIVELGAPKGSDGSGIAQAINDNGVIVGKTQFGSDQHATIWIPGKKGRYTAIDLNTYLPKGSTWNLEEATSINNDGTIVGAGTHPGDGTWMLSLNKKSAAATLTLAPAAAPAPATTPTTSSFFSQRNISDDLLA